jgi:hypothetical protein
MQNTTKDGASVPRDARHDLYESVISDLTALIERVHASTDLIEAAISSESPFGNQEVVANVIVLDDISPCYLRASKALSACSADLGVALHFIKDLKTMRHGRHELVSRMPRNRLSARA